MNGSQVVADFLLAFASLCREGDVATLSPVQRYELESKVNLFVARAETIRLTLPGFPLKSPDRDGKVLGALPDVGERQALAFLNRFCESVKVFYAPGCVIDLFSDGLTFNDLLNIPRNVANAYHHELRTLCASPNIVWHSYSTVDPSFDRETGDVDTVLDPYWRTAPVESEADIPLNGRELELAVLLARERRSVFTEIDTPESQRIEICARRMVQRGIALDGFLAAKLPSGVRLTVHAPKHDTAKVPVKVHAGSDNGALPWHSVLLSQLNGEWLMLSKSDVIQNFDAAIVGKAGKPWYFAEGGGALGASCEISVVHRDDFGLLITPRGVGVGEVDCMSLSSSAIAALTKRYGFVVLRGFRVDDEHALVKFTEQFGRPYEWHKN